MHSDSSLYDELSLTLRAVNNQIKHVEIIALGQDIDPGRLTDSSGQFVMNNLLLAKAQCLNGMAVIKAAQKKAR